MFSKDAHKVHCPDARFKFFRAIILGLFTLLPSITMATETPKYKEISQDGDFEIRLYAPRIIAEVSVTGDLDSASGDGFRTLAGFIFGNNHLATEPGVIVSAEGKHKIAMTAPVTIEPAKLETAFTQSRQWRVEFTMPNQYTLKTLPIPNNPAITIKEIPSKTYAVVRYSGLNTEQRINEETRRLFDWINSHNLEMTGTPELARYNPPWTLPLFRRNEVLVEVRNKN